MPVFPKSVDIRLRVSFSFVVLTLIFFCTGQRGESQIHIWQHTGGPETGLPAALAVSPGTGTIAAAPYSGGVFFKETQGAWRLNVTGLSDLYVTALAPAGAGRFFAGTRGAGVFLYDESTGWNSISNDLPPETVKALFMTRTGTLLAFVQRAGLYALPAGHTRWTVAGEGFPPDLYPVVFTVQMMQDTGGRIWAAVNGGVFFSDDDGNSWTARNQGLPHLNISGGITRNGTGMLFAGPAFNGAYASLDEGNTWSLIDTVGGPKHIRALASDGEGTVLIASDEGLYASTEGGPFFHRVITGAADEQFSLLAVLGPGRFIGFSATDGLWTGGAEGPWTASNEGFLGARISTLHATPSLTLLAGSNYGGVFSSSNGGVQWSRIEAARAATHAFIYDILVTHSGATLLATSDGILRGVGATHSFVSVYRFACMRLMQAADGRIFSGIAGNTIYSTDDGATWRKSDILPTTEYPTAFLDIPGGAVLAGISGEKYWNCVRILDPGAPAWRDLGVGLDSVDVTALCLLDSTIIAGTNDAGVFEYAASQDRWLPLNEGLGAGFVSDLLAGYDSDVYASVWERGVFRRRRGGQWTPVNEGLPNLRVAALEKTNDGVPRLYAGTQGNSVYSALIPGTTSTQALPAPEGIGIHLPSPHPASGTTSVQFTVPNAGYSRLEIWNSLGRRVAILQEGDNPAGSRLIRWDASAYPPGMYMLRLIHGGAVATRRCLVE